VEDLVPGIERILARTGLTPGAIDAVAVSAGPGSFTGLRVGMATAKGFALARGISVYSVSTLAAFARQEIEARKKGDAQNSGGLAGAAGATDTVAAIVPILDARKGRVYGAVFEPDRGARRTEDLDLPVEELVRRVTAITGSRRWVWVGPEATATGFSPAPPISESRSAAPGTALLAAEMIDAGIPPDDPYAGPTYLRSGDIGEKKRVVRFGGKRGDTS